MPLSLQHVRVSVLVLSGILACYFGEQTGLLGPGMSQVFADTVGASGKTISAGKPTYAPKQGNPAWRERGRIVGKIRQCPGCKIEVLSRDAEKVIQTRTVDPEASVYEIEWLQPGVYILRVSAKGYETLVVKGLEVKADNDLWVSLEFGGRYATSGRTISAGKPAYAPKQALPAWKEKGRIVCGIQQCPGCKIEVMDRETEKVIQTCTVDPKATVCEIEWLKPGIYVLRISAKGYDTLIVRDLEIKTNNDLLIRIEF